jgi:hypothetical protein
VACPAGTYTVAAGAAACSECIGGTFSGEEGATSAAACQLCEEGKASNGPGAAKCEVCEEEISESYCVTDGAIATSGIKAAVDAAAAGDVILWNKGTNLDQTWSADGMVVDKAITLECTDVISMCTIDAQASGSAPRRALKDAHGTDESSNYIGIKFTRGYTGGNSNGGGLYIDSSTVTMTSCVISSNIASGNGDGGGLYIDSSTVTMTSCEISSNIASGNGADGGGLYIDSSTVTMTSCEISSNTAR